MDMPSPFIHSFIHKTVDSMRAGALSPLLNSFPSVWCKIYVFTKYFNKQIFCELTQGIELCYILCLQR